MPSATPRLPAGGVSTTSPTTRISLDKVTAGAILAENIRSPSGELLLGAATVLSDRLLRRLRELQPAINLDHVTVFVKDEAKQPKKP